MQPFSRLVISTIVFVLLKVLLWAVSEWQTFSRGAQSLAMEMYNERPTLNSIRENGRQ